MKFFLKMKAWQLFLLLVGLPVALQGVVMGTALTGGNPEVMLILMPFVMLIFMAVFMGWFWTLGTQINKKVPEEIRMGAGFFRFGIIYSTIYVFCFLALILLAATDKVGDGPFALLILPFHLFAMFCMFYGLYFVSRNLVMAETERKVGCYDFAGPFFLIWFYPVGVWFIQPRVNRMFKVENGSHT